MFLLTCVRWRNRLNDIIAAAARLDSKVGLLGRESQVDRLNEVSGAGCKPVKHSHDGAQSLNAVGVGTHKAVRIEPVCQLTQQGPSAAPWMFEVKVDESQVGGNVETFLPHLALFLPYSKSASLYT